MCVALDFVTSVLVKRLPVESTSKIYIDLFRANWDVNVNSVSQITRHCRGFRSGVLASAAKDGCSCYVLSSRTVSFSLILFDCEHVISCLFISFLFWHHFAVIVQFVHAHCANVCRKTL